MPPAARLGDLHVCPMVTGVVPHVGGPIAGPVQDDHYFVRPWLGIQICQHARKCRTNSLLLVVRGDNDAEKRLVAHLRFNVNVG